MQAGKSMKNRLAPDSTKKIKRPAVCAAQAVTAAKPVS